MRHMFEDGGSIIDTLFTSVNTQNQGWIKRRVEGSGALLPPALQLQPHRNPHWLEEEEDVGEESLFNFFNLNKSDCSSYSKNM
jgi:hypothetical protein